MALSAAELIAQKRAKAAGTSAPATQAGFMPPPGQALTPAPKAGPAFAVLSAASQAAGHILPPWATAQSGTLGFNKDGTIDQVAAQIAAEANLPGPEYFAVEIKDGCAHWTTGPEVSDNEDFLDALMGLGLKPSGVTPLTLDWTPPVVAAKEVVKQAVFSFGKKAPAPVAEVAPAPTPEPVAEATPAAVVPEAPKPAKKAKTLPAPALISNIGKADFILYVNCFPVGQKALPISELLVAIGKQMAEQYKKPFYEIDAFARRDSISANADKVLAFVAKAGVDVVVDVNSPDARTVVDALRPYASTVVEAIAR